MNTEKQKLEDVLLDLMAGAEPGAFWTVGELLRDMPRDPRMWEPDAHPQMMVRFAMRKLETRGVVRKIKQGNVNFYRFLYDDRN